MSIICLIRTQWYPRNTNAAQCTATRTRSSGNEKKKKRLGRHPKTLVTNARHDCHINYDIIIVRYADLYFLNSLKKGSIRQMLRYYRLH